jgi:hypothetical protein
MLVLASAVAFTVTVSTAVEPSTKDFPVPVNPLALLDKAALTNRVVPAAV